MNHPIAIVILNWNGKNLLEKFIPTVILHSKNAAIYVVDNASEDSSVEFLKKTYPEVKIIQNKENHGFAKGYNEALKQVDEEILCLLNSDVEVTPNWLEPVLELFETKPEVAIIQPKLLDYKEKDHFEYAGAAGGFIDRYGFPYCRGRIFDTVEPDLGQYNDTTPIFWASGACLFIRKKVFEELKGFDESFFAHMEEIDLCWRCQNLGHQVYYTSNSHVFHVGGATLHKSNPRKTYLNFRNSLYMLVKNSKGNCFTLLFTRLFLDGLAGLRFLFQLKVKDLFAVLHSHVDFYLNLPSLLKQRKENQKNVTHYRVKSIVWAYFILKKHKYNRL